MPATGVRVGHMMPNKPVSDTMPRRGKVTDLCKEWLVHEDGALAYQLQQQEVEKHYSGNKTRNAIVREDIPMARAEQERAEREAFEEHLRQVALLEEHDAQVARRVAEQIEREEEEQRRRLEVHDSRVARSIQEKEKRSAVRGDVNSVGLPLPPSPPHGRPSRTTMAEVEERFRRLQASTSSLDECSGVSEAFAWPPPPDSDQLSRASQEKQDEELAKRLQQEEANAGLDPIDRDRLLAIEVQDSELARMLQEKERARLKRAKEKARAKALAKKQLEEERVRLGADCLPQVVASPTSNNIATAIDPTYSPGSSANSTLTRPQPLAYPAENGYVLDHLSDDYHPPYMPVQGQRRPLSGDKKKKKTKETECKQQ